MSFPTLVYRVPGPYAGPYGKTYNNLGINDAAALAAAIADGWHKTLPEACGVVADGILIRGTLGVEFPLHPLAGPEILLSSTPADDDAPPSRAELEAQASKLGLKFDGRTPDGKLSRMIDIALADADDASAMDAVAVQRENS
jgi:hypothetical protein